MKAKLLFLLALWLLAMSGSAQPYTATWSYAQNVTINGDGSLTKQGASTAWDAGAASNNTLKSDADGWMEFSLTSANTNAFMVGLSSNKTSVTNTYLEYTFYFLADGGVRVYENGSTVVILAVAEVGDVFRISREGAQIKYYRNGLVVRSVATNSSKSLIIDNSISVGTIPFINTSFSDLRALVNITAPTSGLGNGSIGLEVQGGIAPYTYAWTSGESTSTISGKGRGEYQVSITDTQGNQITKTITLGYKTQWTYLSGMTLNPDNSLTKTVVQDDWNTGAASNNRLIEYEDGWMEFVVNEVSGNTYTIGFSNIKTSNDYRSLKYGFYINFYGGILIYESGNNRGQYGTIVQGDILRIFRQGNSIHYYKNGVLLRSSTAQNNESLIIDAFSRAGTIPVPTCSFASFNVRASVQYLDSSQDGSISITTEGGLSPFSYLWSSGETTPNIQNKASGNYTLTITDAEGASIKRQYYLGENAVWDEFLESKLEADNSLSKLAPANTSWNAGASSANRLYPGQDGWLEFVLTNLDSKFFVGLAQSSGNASYQSIEHALYVNYGSLLIYESGSNIGFSIPLNIGDVLRVGREGEWINYYQNGVLVRSVASPSSEFLIADVSISQGVVPPITSSFASGVHIVPTVSYATTSNSASVSLSISGGYPPYSYLWSTGETTSSILDKPIGDYSVSISDSQGWVTEKVFRLAYQVEWIDMVSVSAANNNLLKTGSNPGWNAGAASKNRLALGQDGWVEFKANDIASIGMVGFSKENPNAVQTSIEYALYFNALKLYAYESGASKGQIGTYQYGDTLRVERVGGTIQYKKNGVILYSSLVPSSSELGLDLSLNSLNCKIEDVKTSFGTSPILPTTNLHALMQGSKAQINWTNGGGTGRIVIAKLGSPIQTAPTHGINYNAHSTFGVGDLIGTDQYVVYNGSDSTCTLTGIDLNQEYFISVFEYTIDGLVTYHKLGYPEISIKGYGIQWVNKTNIEETDQGLKKTTLGSTWDAGASSTNKLKNGQDGWFEFSPSHSSTYAMVGLSQKDINIQNSSIDYAIYVRNNGTVLIHETGVVIGNFGTYQPNDVFRIERVNNVVTYYKNGVALYTSTKLSTTDLVVDVSVYSPNLILRKLRASFYDPQFKLSERISHIVYQNDGKIDINVFGGVQPYSYLWDSDETGKSIADKPFGAYTLTVTDALGNDTTKTYNLGYKVLWHKVTGAIDQDSLLMSTINLSNWGSSGAKGLNMLSSNQDGWLDFAPGKISIKGVVNAGFTQNQVGYYSTSISYGFYFVCTSSVKSAKIYELSSIIDVGTFEPWDIYRVSREGNEMKYYKNDSLLRATIVDPSEFLHVKANPVDGNLSAISASFKSQVASEPILTGSELGLANGSIKVKALGGIPPYTYEWSSGEESDSIGSKSPGEYWVAVKDSENKVDTSYYNLGFKPVWEDLQGVYEDQGKLVKTGANGWVGSGGIAHNQLAPQTDGWIEFRFENQNHYAIGFATDTVLDLNAFSWGVYTDYNLGSLYRWNGSSYDQQGYIESGDLIRIARVGDKLKYFRNGLQLTEYNCDPSIAYHLKVVVNSGSAPIINTSFSTSGAEGLLADQAEYQALKALFESTDGANWDDNSGWPYPNWPATASHQDFANWYGVTVSQGDVHQINLPYNLLKGHIPAQVLNLLQLDTMDIEGNEIWSFPDLASHPNKDSLLVNAASNYLDFAQIDLLSDAGLLQLNYSPQKDFPLSSGQKLHVGEVLKWTSASAGRNGAIFWYKMEEGNPVEVNSQSQGADSSIFQIDSVTLLNEGAYYWEITNDDYPDITLYSQTAEVFVIESGALLEENRQVPAALKATAEGRYKSPLTQAQFYLDELSTGDVNDLMEDCMEGKYYAGFQLFYDLADRNTQEEWSAYLQIKLFKGTDTLWTETLHVDMITQTFIATAFYQELVECFEDYRYEIAMKSTSDNVPQEDIHLRVLLYKHLEDAFIPSSPLSLSFSSQGGQKNDITWTYNGPAVLEFDLEWVYIADHEGFTGSTAQEAFSFKEPLRITTADYIYQHHNVYPKGNIWYRARAVGYNPAYPDHRIPGHWFYGANEGIAASNTNPYINWQLQTTFAEEGKYKKVISHYDGSLRQRQVRTNLSSEEITLVAETLYDFEGRQSVSILAAPVQNQNLSFGTGFHQFMAMDDSVAANTDTNRKKFHYDNGRLENSILSSAVGASQYYSPQNNSEGIHSDYIPDAEGYAYSQTEYLNDGTGRVSRQSGVGEAFKMEGDHVVRNYYSEASEEELVRLFGSNVGNATHYKKNMVVDANGQISLSYLDQAGRVVATALAGDSTSNLDALPSYKTLTPSPLKVNLSYSNTRTNQGTSLVKKIINVKPNTVYTFNYKIEAFASLVEDFGCQDCNFDVKLSITNPQGEHMELPVIAGNESPDNLSYQRGMLTASDCSIKTELSNISFQVLLPEIGDYTLVKTLKVHELSFEQMQTEILQEASVIQEIQQIWQYYPTDPNECEICIEDCEGIDELIDETMSEVASINCTNIYNRIVQDLKEQSGDDGYEPDQQEIEEHGLYCQYELCLRDNSSEVFDMKLARIPNWSTAQSAGFANPIALDPFFNIDSLNGSDFLDEMQTRLDNVFVGTVRYDSNGDGEIDEEDNTQDYEGPIQEVTDPANTDFYVAANGQANVNGKHLLYMDLMNRRAALGETAYQEELDALRWNLFRGFYMEAKRKTKLEDIGAYNGCDSARAVLEYVDNLPTTEADVIAWGEEQGYTGPISNEELEMSIRNIAFVCDTVFSVSDSTAIQTHLASYFNGNPSNFFKIIMNEDLAGNADLLAIDNILENYNCSLDRVSLDNPMTCLRDTTITLPADLPIFKPKDLLLQGQYQTESLAERKMASSATPVEDKSKTAPKPKTKKAYKTWQQYEAEGDTLTAGMLRATEERNALRRKEVEAEVEAKIQAKMAEQSGTNNRSSMAVTTSSMMSSSIPSQAEYDALIDLYNSTGGDNWINNTGWADATDTIQSVAGWYGVNTDSEGNITSLFLGSNNLVGSLPPSINDLANLYYLQLSFNDISSLPPDFGLGWTEILSVELGYNELTSLPDSFGADWGELITLSLDSNQISTLPNSFGETWGSIEYLNLSKNQLTELPGFFGLGWYYADWIDLSYNSLDELPELFGQSWHYINWLDMQSNELTTLPELFGQGWYDVFWVNIGSNELSSLPEQFGNSWGGLHFLSLYDNYLTDLPNSFGVSWNPNNWVTVDPEVWNISFMYGVHVESNFLTFEDNLPVNERFNSPKFGFDFQKYLETYSIIEVDSLIVLTTDIDRTTSPPSLYQWYREAGFTPVALQPSFDEANHTIILSAEDIHFGVEYFYEITNIAAPGTFLRRNPIVFTPKQIDPEPTDSLRTITYCLEYDMNNVTLAGFQFTVDWNQRMQECMGQAVSRDSLLVELATEKLIEEKVNSYYNSFHTQCLTQLTEKINYTYTPKEYHYTLYYYDQSGSLVQTVPPQGVHPLSAAQVDSILDNSLAIEPDHTLVTRYQYNSLNQLVSQQTPDAGHSGFWYNAKSQLRLSQNAQQALDSAYSYTKYDALGRIIEVGELKTSTPVNELIAQLDNLSFPSAADPDNSLSDLTKTHYDFASWKAPSGFVQENLRNRVAWVEVIDKNSTDTTATFYSYDIHGNVKSLVQLIPGLATKRTDYRYDLVSGNVNYVFYQAEQPDQFIHRYEYDADNRIRKAFTSTDGFIWNKEAEYFYYQHGPLARIELGEFNTQGIDYYYTLQGWLKGANMPFAGDPGRDGHVASGADAFAFNLGYYQGDYKAIGAGVSLPEQTTPSLWGNGGQGALYNGNIAWMMTDLPSLGLADQDRSKGLQAMQYQYDQLNRIKSSKSLLQFAEGTGFAQRNAQGQAYDEAYTYDANGNLLGLKRNDETGDLEDDFEYTYYAGTNKLQRVKAGAGTTYEYDAIGNLIMDHEEGTQISWTPYGKVREVHKGDSLIIRYRYDASGNRVEKKVTTLSSGEGQVEALTRYVRDASGNVMAVYKETIQAGDSSAGQAEETPALPAEYHLYGSSRLGISTAKARHGHLTLGMRNYELSNHLGNVLAVVSDKANYTPGDVSGPWGDPDAPLAEDSPWYEMPVWATVLSTSDYYPFGLEMAGRSASDTTAYRYGFNGKEKDTDFANHYDYGFRIYNPRIAKFLSVDPLTMEYPWYTPYQFAGNKPIRFIDLDGLEEMDKMEMSAAATGTTVLVRETVGTMTFNEAMEFVGKKSWKGAKFVGGVVFATAIFVFTSTDLNGAEQEIMDDKNRKLSERFYFDYLEQKILNGEGLSDDEIDSYVVLSEKITGKRIHGNDKRSTKPQIIYKIFIVSSGEVLKFGISGDGVSRPKSQIEDLEEEYGEKVDYKVIDRAGNNEDARKLEQKHVDDHFESKGRVPDKQDRPKPTKSKSK